jgi:hypothetical protein
MLIERISTFQSSGRECKPHSPAWPRCGKPWRTTTRQLCSTVAWRIANWPFETIAGVIQYKHAGIAGYEVMPVPAALAFAMKSLASVLLVRPTIFSLISSAAASARR